MQPINVIIISTILICLQTLPSQAADMEFCKDIAQAGCRVPWISTSKDFYDCCKTMTEMCVKATTTRNQRHMTNDNCVLEVTPVTFCYELGGCQSIFIEYSKCTV